jgi:thioredoxin-like negative regulator of GroEL
MEIKKIHSDQDFKEFISQDKSIVLIHKTGCPYCEKALTWIEHDIESSLPIGKANKDDIPKILDLIQIPMYPTFILFEKGSVKDIFYGDTVFDKVKDFIKRNE